MDDKTKGCRTRAYVLNYIKSYISKNKYAPSFREIAEGTGLKSISTVHKHLNMLKGYGLIDYNKTQPRTIVLKEGA